MIIVDLNQVMISNLMRMLGTHIEKTEIDENLLRHFILNSIRSYNKKFRSEHGEQVIACDDGFNWRKEIFPYYKAHRKKDREESVLDWNLIFQSINKIRDEIKEYFPYRVIQVRGAEADDVIGTLVQEYGNTMERILIVSGDKDFKQLQKYLNVRQYDPVKSEYLEEKNPERYLRMHIMEGDKGDGVPNFLSAGDSYVLGKRCKQLRQTRKDEWVNEDPEVFCVVNQNLNPEVNILERYRQNEKLVDLSFTPQDIRDKILEEYRNQEGKDRSKLWNYFVTHKLKNLMSDLDQF